MFFSFLAIANKVMEAIEFSCKAGGISILLLGQVCLEVGGDTLGVLNNLSILINKHQCLEFGQFCFILSQKRHHIYVCKPAVQPRYVPSHHWK